MNSSALPHRSGTMTLAAFGAAALLHVDRAPLWASAVAGVALVWQWLHLHKRLALPGNAARALITVTLLLGTLASYRTLSGLSAGGTLLLVMGAAKLLEIRQPRDARVIALAALALLLAACLESQSLPRVPLYLASGWLALAALAALGGEAESLRLTRALVTTARSLLIALPLGLLCFVFVPRLPGALWSLPADSSAQSGLGDEMTPGGISDLSMSEDVAFRVRFQDTVPPMAQRYWRGPVLHEFDGYTWRRGRIAVPQPVEPASAPLRYEVMLEPTGRNFLFGLDAIYRITGPRNFPRFDGQVTAARSVTSVLTYEGLSYLRVRPLAPLSATGRRLDTQLPEQRNPRARALALQLRAEVGSDREYLQRVLRYFHDAGFEYSHAPPLLNQDSVDDLIFRTRLGFCGHFASAYVTMLRAAGIPARVVTGYLGGDWNPVGGYYVVRQSDAHAWTEAWLEDAGWVRIDPTAVVAPERLRRNVNELLGAGASFTGRLFVGSPWLHDLRNAWDATSAWWQQHVVDYNMAAQLGLLDRLGLGGADYGKLALILLCGALLWGAWVYTRHPRTTGPQPDELAAVWQSFAVLLQRRGLSIASHEPPRAVAMRSARRFPAAAADIAAFSERYLQLRFGLDAAAARPGQIRELRGLLRRLARATAAGRQRRTA
jgi:transglutaminase-like putative cysteine protease